jgi:hypothetical protein
MGLYKLLSPNTKGSFVILKCIKPFTMLHTLSTILTIQNTININETIICYKQKLGE